MTQKNCCLIRFVKLVEFAFKWITDCEPSLTVQWTNQPQATDLGTSCFKPQRHKQTRGSENFSVVASYTLWQKVELSTYVEFSLAFHVHIWYTSAVPVLNMRVWSELFACDAMKLLCIHDQADVSPSLQSVWIVMWICCITSTCVFESFALLVILSDCTCRLLHQLQSTFQNKSFLIQFSI